jgi:hypothetical protein
MAAPAESPIRRDPPATRRGFGFSKFSAFDKDVLLIKSNNVEAA